MPSQKCRTLSVAGFAGELVLVPQHAPAGTAKVRACATEHHGAIFGYRRQRAQPVGGLRTKLGECIRQSQVHAAREALRTNGQNTG